MGMYAIEWTGSELRLLDQRLLPNQEVWETYRDAASVADAIRSMKVRGAPAIGATAAYGIALEANRLQTELAEEFKAKLDAALSMLAATRPTAVNLFWAIRRMRSVLERYAGNPAEAAKFLTDEAVAIAREDIASNREIGRHGATLFPGKAVRVLTHCNTGSLATVEYGTALGVIRALHEQHRLKHVWVDETRPFLQGARLTAYELAHEGIAHTLITDNMAAHFMKLGEVDGVVVGADRIARNGDTANKIGTYALAVLCHFHKLPFYVAAPTTTFDLTLASGNAIPIEERGQHEVTQIHGHSIAPANTHAAHPAFDVTPHELITGIITERGVILAPNDEQVGKTVGQAV